MVHSTTASARLWASALALAFAVAQMAGLFHLAFVRHAPCLEHGGLVHVEDQGSHDHASGEIPAQEGPALLAVEAGEDAHDDCAFVLCERPAVSADPVAAIDPPRPVLLPTYSGALRSSAAPKVALWALAPKRGPPHVS